VTVISDSDFPQLSPRVRTAIASIGSPSDLRLRTTLRDNVQVWSTWLPVQGYYETFVVSSTRHVHEAMQAHGVRDCEHYATKAEAERGHEVMCGRVLAVLDAMKESA